MTSYDKKGNDHQNFFIDIKCKKLPSNLDIRRSGDLTLFGGVLIIQSLGISPLVYIPRNKQVRKDAIKQFRVMRTVGHRSSSRSKQTVKK